MGAGAVKILWRNKDFFLDLRGFPLYPWQPFLPRPTMAAKLFPVGHIILSPPRTRFIRSVHLNLSMLSTNSQPPVLPTAPENDWRFSYQFVPNRSTLVARIVLGVGVLGLMIVVAQAAW